MKKYSIDILALVVSVIALCFSFYTYKRHQHQLLEDKQIDAVVELVDYIQDCKLSILFTPEPIEMEKRKEVQVYTFFELADTTIRSDMDLAPIFFHKGKRLTYLSQLQQCYRREMGELSIDEILLPNYII